MQHAWRIELIKYGFLINCNVGTIDVSEPRQCEFLAWVTGMQAFGWLCHQLPNVGATIKDKYSVDA